MAVVSIMSAKVLTDDGHLAALVDVVEVGGGSQVVTVDGTPEVRVHPSSQVFHARLISPDIMVPDQLKECATYEQALEFGVVYAGKLTEHAATVAGLASDLQVD